VIVAYLMKKRGWRLAESYKWVKEKRPTINISGGESRLRQLFHTSRGGGAGAVRVQARVEGVHQPGGAAIHHLPLGLHT